MFVEVGVDQGALERVATLPSSIQSHPVLGYKCVFCKRSNLLNTWYREYDCQHTHGDLLVMGEKRSAFNFLGRDGGEKKERGRAGSSHTEETRSNDSLSHLSSDGSPS